MNAADMNATDMNATTTTTNTTTTTTNNAMKSSRRLPSGRRWLFKRLPVTAGSLFFCPIPESLCAPLSSLPPC
jgi:hypothetical protein